MPKLQKKVRRNKIGGKNWESEKGKMAEPFKGEGEKMANALLKRKRGKGEKGEKMTNAFKRCLAGSRFQVHSSYRISGTSRTCPISLMPPIHWAYLLNSITPSLLTIK